MVQCQQSQMNELNQLYHLGTSQIRSTLLVVIKVIEMENCKIKVNNEAESKEAQELFFELGYGFFSGKNKAAEEFKYTGGFYFFAYGSDCDLTVSKDHNLFLAKNDFQETTLPQLRDLVVLHRNDVSDATHIDIRKEHIYLTTDKVIYYWQGEWCKSAINNSNGYEDYIANSLTPIQKPQPEQGLISGADALKAMMEGKRVLYSGYGNQDWDTALNCNLGVFLKHEKFPDFTFKIVPKTINLSLEIPAPFEPKGGDTCFIMDSEQEDGFYRFQFSSNSGFHNKLIQLGAWRTEEEIKQVVAALRGGVKG